MFAIRPTAQTEPESFILKGISFVVNQHKKKCIKFDCAVVCFVSYISKVLWQIHSEIGQNRFRESHFVVRFIM